VRISRQLLLRFPCASSKRRGAVAGLRAIAPTAVACFLVIMACAQSDLVDQMTTQERIAKYAWWPTKGSVPSDKYVGNEACVGCHAAIAKSQAKSEMGQTLLPAADSLSLTSNFGKPFKVDGFIYQVNHGPESPIFSVSVSEHNISKPLVWAFGSGKISQVYFTPEKDTYNESHFSYFDSISGFDLTPAQPAVRVAAGKRQSGDALQRAGGRTVEMNEARRCFACHTSNVPANGPITNVASGLTCEACHGPGGNHAAAEHAGLPQSAALIMNPAHLRPVDQVDFCGACHATSMDIQMGGGLGLPTVRFPAYRLLNSRCWMNDRRIQCTACHDPHEPLVHETSAYDEKCLACHVVAGAAPSSEKPGKACSTATKDCAGCHMPKYDFPDVHHKFTDHHIRVVRAGAPIPG